MRRWRFHLPGPAVRLFDLGLEQDSDQTVRRSAHDEKTVSSRPEVEWALTDACRDLGER